MRSSSTAAAALLAAALCLTGATAQAQVNQAYTSANCTASFLSTCVDIESTTLTESAPASPAPLPVIGASLWEAGILGSSLLTLWLVQRKRRIRGGRSG